MLRGVFRFWLFRTPKPIKRGTGDNLRGPAEEVRGLLSTSLSNLLGTGGVNCPSVVDVAIRPEVATPPGDTSDEGELRGVELTLRGAEFEFDSLGFARLGVELTDCVERVGDARRCSARPVCLDCEE